MQSLKEFHTFHLNQKAASVSNISNVDQLSDLVGKTLNKDFVLLGSGSNSLFLEDIDIPVYINQLKGVELKEDEKSFRITVASGEDWHEFVEWCLNKNIYGLENLALIPGTVGAAPIQNIGAYGKEVRDFISSVEYIDLISGQKKQLKNSECQFAYRDSIFKGQLRDTAIITSVTFNIPKEWQANCRYGDLQSLINPSAEDIFHKVIEIRRSKLPDPKALGNAGSFFKNPIVDSGTVDSLLRDFPDMPNYEAPHHFRKLAAGWLIDQCGLKGLENGKVQVHKKQALVLVNKLGTAQGKDVVEIANDVIERVFTKFGIRLEPEVRLFGRQGESILPNKSEQS